MIRHLVLFRFREDIDPADVDDAIDVFRALSTKIAEVRSFEDGINVSPEGLGHGYDHAFLLGFDDAAARDVYLHHPAHTAFVASIQPLIAKALVFDWVAA